MSIARVIICTVAFGTALVCQAETWTGRADISFKGSSTLHDFHGHGEAEPFAAEMVEPGAKGAPMLTCRTELKVGQLSTDNKSRDKSMYAMFRLPEFPVISASISNSVAGSATVPVVVTILGKEQVVQADAMDWAEAPDRVAFTLAFDISLESYGLKAPRAAIGLIKVGDVVRVTVDVELTGEKGTKP